MQCEFPHIIGHAELITAKNFVRGFSFELSERQELASLGAIPDTEVAGIRSLGKRKAFQLAEIASGWQALRMAYAPLLEEPVVVHTRPAIELDEEQFFQFCQLNNELQIERTADGDILIMAPEGGSSGAGSSKLNANFVVWAERDGTGQVFGSSTGFILPNGAVRSPDIAWVRNERLESLT